MGALLSFQDQSDTPHSPESGITRLGATSKLDEAARWHQRADEQGLMPATPQTSGSAVHMTSTGGRGGTSAPGTGKGPGGPEPLDLRVHDRVALDELELYGEVLSAVAGADRPLTAEQLDEVLGVRQAADPDHVLTQRQSKILQVIQESVERNGCSPSIREIAEAAGLKSTSVVSHQLSILADKGYLCVDKGRAHTVKDRLSTPK